MKTTAKGNRILSAGLFWGILLVGLLLPWTVGVWVKISLQAKGMPTFPWLYFLAPGRILGEAFVSAYWALPFTGLAFLGRYGLEARLPFFDIGPCDRVACIIFSFVVGVWRAVPLFRDLFLEFHPIVFLYPWFVRYGRDMVLALLAGWLALGLKNRFLHGE